MRLKEKIFEEFKLESWNISCVVVQVGRYLLLFRNRVQGLIIIKEFGVYEYLDLYGFGIDVIG